VEENTKPIVIRALPDELSPLPPPFFLVFPFDITALPAHSSFVSFVSLDSIINKIVTPYCSATFNLILSALHLSHRHAGLLIRILRGFSISVPDSPLSSSIIPPYCPSEDDCHINDYLQEELGAECMSGPFSGLEMHSLCDSHFMACPVHVITTTDEFDKIKRHVVHNTVTQKTFLMFGMFELVTL